MFSAPATTTAATTATPAFTFNLPTASTATATLPIAAATSVPPLTFGSTGGGDAGPKLATGLFGKPGAPTVPVLGVATTTPNVTAPAASTATPLLLSGLTSTSVATSIAPVTSKPMPTLTLGANQANLTTATKTTESSAAATTAAPNAITYNQLEEYINKWTLELEEQEKIFTDQSTQINTWDQLLISNNQKIVDLNQAVQKVKAEQQTLEQELEFIATQHTELEESIAPLQKEFNKMPQIDVERSQVYLTVENLDTQLKQMSEDLKEVIDNLNEANKGQDNTDPIIQIGKILNAHMSSLQWIENTSSTIGSKLDDLTKMHESFKRDSERSFRSAYYN